MSPEATGKRINSSLRAGHWSGSCSTGNKTCTGTLDSLEERLKIIYNSGFKLIRDLTVTLRFL